MSLINDALRRATTQKKHTPNDLPTMQPLQRPKSQGGGPGLTVILICFVVAGAVTLGAWSYWNRKYKNPGEAERRQAAAAAASKTNAPTTAATTTNNNPIARAANTLNKIAAQNQEGEKTAEAIQPGATTPPKLQPLPQPAAKPSVTASSSVAGLPKLQGIFFRAKDATAILNGVTVKVGDEVQGARVTAIKRTSVTIQTASGSHELMMK